MRVELDVFRVDELDESRRSTLLSAPHSERCGARAPILLCGVVLRWLVACARRPGEQIFLPRVAYDIRDTLSAMF